MNNTEHEGNLRVLDPDAAAEVLGISRAQLRLLTSDGTIGHVRIGRGTRRVHVGYLRRHLEEFLSAREVAAK